MILCNISSAHRDRLFHGISFCDRTPEQEDAAWRWIEDGVPDLDELHPDDLHIIAGVRPITEREQLARELESLTNADLMNLCAELDLPRRGSKYDRIARVVQHCIGT